MYHFCTYFDKNYLSRGLVLLESLQKHAKPFKLYVLSLDDFTHEFLTTKFSESVESISLIELEAFDQELLAVKPARKLVEYYFTLTPCLPRYIFHKHSEIELITYIDADICFFSSPQPAFDELGEKSVLIVPHHFSEKNKDLEKCGKYNVVFNVFRRDEEGMKVLNWWRNQCLDWCYDYLDEVNSRFGDQKYLDYFPAISKRVVVSNLKGLNVAAFNVDRYKIARKKEKFYVDEKLIIFYHFHYLKKIRPQLFLLYHPEMWEKSMYSNSKLISLYIFYSRRILSYEKKYGLNYDSLRNYWLGLPNKKELINSMIYDYPLMVSSIYTGIVHLEKYHKLYKYLAKGIRFIRLFNR
jgi:hypothetical protein